MTNRLFSVEEKVILITGGAGILGSSMAKHLLSEGAKIVILDLQQERIEETVRDLKKTGSQVAGYACNVLDKQSLEEVREKILNKFQKIDALINAAGGNMEGATIGENQTIFDLKIEDFRKVSELNLDGTVLPSIVFGEAITNNGKGNIINISSMTATRAITRVVGYSASKAAVDIFTKWLATEFALKFSDKVRVNAIAPGFFIGNQNRALLIKENGGYTSRAETILRNTPMKRFGNADELNGTIQWLLSDASSFVTGTVIPIDGGFSAFSGV